MFNHEIIIDKHELKLRIQSEIMHMIEDLKKSNNIGYTSWVVAENVVKRIDVDNRKKNKFSEWLEAKF